MLKAGKPFNITASGLISRGPCIVRGYYVTSVASSPTLAFHNAVNGDGTAAWTTPALSANNCVQLDAYFDTALYVVVANTINVTLFVEML